MRSVSAAMVPLFEEVGGLFQALLTQAVGIGVNGFAGAEGWGYDAVGGILGQHPTHAGLIEHVGVSVDAAGDFYGGSGAGAGGLNCAKGGHDGCFFVGDHVPHVFREGEAGGEAEVFGDAAEEVGGKVGVAVDESGEDGFAPPVDDLSVWVNGADLRGGAEGRNATAFDGDGAVVKDGAGRVTGDYGGVFYDDGLHGGPFVVGVRGSLPVLV